MKNLKNVLLFFILFMMVFLFACESPMEDAVKETKFDLIINNHTNEVYDVYMKTDADNKGFSKVGVLYASNIFHYYGLVIKVNYTFRLVLHDDLVSNKKHEKIVKSTNNTTYIWDVYSWDIN